MTLVGYKQISQGDAFKTTSVDDPGEYGLRGYVDNSIGSGVHLGSSGPPGNTQSNHTKYPCPAIGDINGDGLLDVLVGSGGPKFNGQNTNIYTYLNTGSKTIPNFAPPLAFGSDGAISKAFGAFGCCPVLVDFNGDGLVDIVVNDMANAKTPHR